MSVFERLGSVQFDPISPVGCNHDLVLHSRYSGYRIGDWQKLAYEERRIYDGWDKQASLVPFEGWGWRRFFHQLHRRSFDRIFLEHPEAVDIVLGELRERGPLMPKDFNFQRRKEEWKGSWHGPSLTKQTLRALWHAGKVMTVNRRQGQHLYDLTERVLPEALRDLPPVEMDESIRELVRARHRTMGLIKPTAPYEVWSYIHELYAEPRKQVLNELVARGELIQVSVEGKPHHADPAFLRQLDSPALEPKVVLVAPLDPLLWDRKMVRELFDFDYTWEIYTPEVKRKWGYYVLPVLFGHQFVARVEFQLRKETLEVVRWIPEVSTFPMGFGEALEKAMASFVRYCGASEVTGAKMNCG